MVLILQSSVKYSFPLLVRIYRKFVTTQPEMRRKAKIGVKNSNANKTDTE